MIKNKRKLILGHAGKEHNDAITLDIDPLHNPDIVHNLNECPWPFKDNSFDEIICHHVVEHLESLDKAMQELYRIASAKCRIYIEVPHHSSWFANTPEHPLRFNYFSFDGYLTLGVKQEWITTMNKFDLIKREVTFHKSFRRVLLNKIFNKYPLTYERFWTYIFPAEHLKLILQPNK